jgi:5-(carboxyamino)imidazole ribonucleotide mutase
MNNLPENQSSFDSLTHANGAIVGVIMGSVSDWPTMRHTVAVLEQAGIPHECRVISAHRTPHLLYHYALAAEQRGLRCIIAGAGGAAHLPGMTAALTTLPVLGVPVRSRSLGGIDSLLSILQMPFGVPVGTFSVGETGAEAAAHFVVRMLNLTESTQNI